MSLILEILYLCSAKKFISHDTLQNIDPNMARTCKNKFYENKIKFNRQNLFKKIYYGITDRGQKETSPPCQIGLN